MQKSDIRKLEKRIEKIRGKLAQIEPMRPGSISKQYRDRKNRKGIYYQLSYTHKMQSRTEHVWPEHVELLGKEIKEYKSYKSLTNALIDLSIELSKAKITYLRGYSDP